MQLSPLYLEQLQAAERVGEERGKQLGEQLYLEQLQAAERVGEERGKQQNQQEIALKMLRENISVETIARITELSLEQIQQLRPNL
jgi:predicted transposase/invertase (TIGR01784 family)